MRAIHVSVRVAPLRGALSHGDLLKLLIIISIIYMPVVSEQATDSGEPQTENHGIYNM